MAALIADMADITMPIQPRKGQIVVITSVGKKILNRCMNSAKYIAAKYDPEIGTDEG